MEKVMLTCIRNHDRALRLFRKLDYAIDASSPDADEIDPELRGCAVPMLDLLTVF
jgi:hypothetical protein